MYTLYFLPGACSLATLAIINELNLPVRLIQKQKTENFEALNPAGTVPVLLDGKRVLNEGVAILLYLLDKHDNLLLAREGEARHQAVENMMFANASMHPAYCRLFFIEGNIPDEIAKRQSFTAAAKTINKLWAAVEKKLQEKIYLSGQLPSPADFLLTVYSRWGQFFPVNITIGPNAQRMIDAIVQRDSFQKALQFENDFSVTTARETEDS